jgi:hypothetical protein
MFFAGAMTATNTTPPSLDGIAGSELDYDGTPLELGHPTFSIAPCLDNFHRKNHF